MKNIRIWILYTILLGIVSHSFAQNGSDTIRLKNAEIISIDSKEMRLYGKSSSNPYDSKIVFKLSDSSHFTINYKGQFPIPSNRGPIIVTSDHCCSFVTGDKFDIMLVKRCVKQAYASQFVNFYSVFASSVDSVDCSVFEVKKPAGRHIPIVSMIHNFVDIDRRIYEMLVITCTSMLDKAKWPTPCDPSAIH